MWEMRANLLLPKASKSCPKSNKSPDLVTLPGIKPGDATIEIALTTCLRPMRPDWAIFWNFLVTHFIRKVVQIFGDFLSRTGEATFWATFGTTWATFYFYIWSLCLDP